MEPTRKGAELNSLGRDSHCSQRGIAKVLAAVKRDGIPEAFSERTQYRDRKRFARLQTPCGTLVERKTLCLSDGTEEVVGIQNPLAFFYQSVLDCKGFGTMVERAIARSGVDVPWGLILYNDGITPQDSASSHDQRKLISIYWAFREYGAAALCAEESWGILATIRTKVLSKYHGGLSRFTTEVLDNYFFNEAGRRNLETGFQLPDGTVLKGNMWCFIADEPALKDFFLVKGHAGLLPCCLCRNVVLHRFFDARVHCAPFVSTACFDWDAFQLHSDASIRGLYLHLAEAHGRGELDEEMEISTGLGYSDFGLIHNRRVHVATQLMYDWPHCYVVGGLLDIEIGQCFRELSRVRSPTTYAVLGGFLEHWTWPHRQSPPIGKLFDEAAIRSHSNAGAFKANASDIMSLAPVLNFFLTRVTREQGFSLPQVDSLIACIDVVELLMCVRHGVVTADTLKTALLRHLRLYKAAYGEEACRPKHHYALHLWKMLRDFGTLISCLTLERLHKVPKRYVANRRNTTSYELGTIEDPCEKSRWPFKQPTNECNFIRNQTFSYSAHAHAYDHNFKVNGRCCKKQLRASATLTINIVSTIALQSPAEY